MQSYYFILKELMENSGDSIQADKMSAYMKNQFIFYGIPSSQRKNLYKDFLKLEKKRHTINWNLLDECFYDEHREFQYFVCDYLSTLSSYLTFEDLNKIKIFIQKGNWWDITDALDTVIGDIGLKDIRIKQIMIEWSKSDNIWLKRTSIDHQLLYKEKTDTEVLSIILLNCIGSKEFFINKAMGWALRQYSKTNPEWVISFLDQYQEQLSSLTIKEASKYITKKRDV